MLTAPSAQADGEADVGFTRWKVGLRPVEVPTYLRSKAMAVRTGTNEIRFAEFDLWAEPLDQGIRRVMKETLRSAPNVENVTLNSHGDDTLDYEVTIRILACEGARAASGEGSFRFAATWELRSAGRNSGVTRYGLFAADPAPWNGKDYGQLAERLSEAIAGVSKAVAASLPTETKTPANRTTEETTP